MEDHLKNNKVRKFVIDQWKTVTIGLEKKWLRIWNFIFFEKLSIIFYLFF